MACCVELATYGGCGSFSRVPVAFRKKGYFVRVFCGEVGGPARSHSSKVVAYNRPFASI